MYHIADKLAKCAKCEKPIDVVIQGEDSKEVEEEELIPENPKPNSNQEDGSKKIGEYLLSGWCMKETSCSVCLMPHMKSRQGQLVCVNCGPVVKKINKTQEENNKKNEGLGHSKN